MSGKSNIRDVSLVNHGSQINKRAAVNWTIGKLINIVLLTLVMALIIYGMTTGGLNPLIENVENKFNEVLMMMPSWLGGVSSEECFSSKVVDLGGGKVFLEKIGLSGSSLGMNVCRDRMCNFTGGFEDYRKNKGVSEKFDRNNWRVWDNLLVGDLESARFDWEVYRKVSSILEESEGVDFFTNFKSTRKFVLMGDGSGVSDREISMTWQDNVWVIRVGSWTSVFYDDDAAIDEFARNVWSGDDDVVTYDDGMGDSGEIGKLVENIGWFSSYDELDSDEEIAKLKVEFAKRKVEYLDEVRPSKEAFDNLIEAVKDKEFVLDGSAFVMEAVDFGGELVILIVSNEIKLGLKYIVRGGPGTFPDCDRNSLPFVLVEWDGSWKERGNDDYYKLEGTCFENVYRESLIERFLSSKCR